MSFDPNASNLFTGFNAEAFDQSASDAAKNAGGDSKRRRDDWPVLRYLAGNDGKEEVSIRILPFTPAHTKGHWVRTKNNKTFWADCPAFDPVSNTSNGTCPICQLKISNLSTNMIAYVIDMKHYKWMHDMGLTPDRWKPIEPGTEISKAMHPFRVFSMSSSLLKSLENIRAKKGSASDAANGYYLDVVRTSTNNKIDYQIIPGERWPLDQGLVDVLAKMGMPNIAEWHEPEDHAGIVKSLFFNGHVGFEQANSILQSYVGSNVISKDQMDIAVKAMTTYAGTHNIPVGNAAGAPPPPPPAAGVPGMPLPGALPGALPTAPGMPAPGGLPAPGFAPPTGLPVAPAPVAAPFAPPAVEAAPVPVPAPPVAAAPALPAPVQAAAPAPAAIPAPPAPALPAAPALPSPVPVAAAPAAPALPTPAIPAAPAMPAAPVMPAPPIPTAPAAPAPPSAPVAGSTEMLA